MIHRRQFISLLGGATVAWPVAARAQQPERMRRVGILVGGAVENTSETKASVAAFRQALAQLGWTEGRNLRIDSLVAVGSPDNVSEYQAELATLAPASAALAPDVILTNGTETMEAMSRATSAVPIVFVNATDPSAAGFVNGSSRPGGNATGFSNFPNSIASKWLELLKELAPSVTRVGILRDPATTARVEQWTIIQTAAKSLGVEVIQANLGHEPEIVRAFGAFARSSDKGSNSGIIVITSTLATVHRELTLIIFHYHGNRILVYFHNKIIDLKKIQ